jgi:hypothetical protein
VRGCALGNIVHAGPLGPDAALATGERWVGPGYRQVAPGIWRSADGLRQFRMVTDDLEGSHSPFVPHVHFEAFDSLGERVENNHVPVTP